MTKPIDCSLCGAHMHLTELKSTAAGLDNKSYIWVCEDCPGILLEWWNSPDTDAFVKYISNRDGIIKEWQPEHSENNI